MVSQIDLGGIVADVVRKDIKHVYFRICSPTGRVRISAPRRMSTETIRVLAGPKLDWIKRKQARARQRPPEPRFRYVDGESHSVWGEPYGLRVTERDAPPVIELQNGHMLLRVRPGTDENKRQALAAKWYREQIREAVVPLLARWQPLMGVSVERVFVRRMKTRWGSCNSRACTIRLNTELARMPPECFEYVVVHELVHLLEPSHSARFYALMDRFMPTWRGHRERLDRRPLRDKS